MNAEAVAWLMREFEYMSRVRTRVTACYRPLEWTGPRRIRPMAELLPVMDAGVTMRVVSSDYADPERWWL